MLTNDNQYKELLLTVKEQIRSSQIKAALSVNTAVIQLYWNIGEMIAHNQVLFEGRNNYINQLAIDIKAEFPDMQGFSKRNLFDIRRFFLFYNTGAAKQIEEPISINSTSTKGTRKKTGYRSVRQLAALNAYDNQSFTEYKSLLSRIPWGHHLVILNKVKHQDEAIYYVRQTIEHNWSRTILTLQIDQNLYARQGKAFNNFKTTLPDPQAQIALQMLKDPYNFAFLELEPQIQELEIEKRLTEHITRFLLELGKGFAFIGRQYPIEVGEKEYRIDLLFYHIRLRSFVVIDLKTVSFEPEFTGKMNFYLSAVDETLKQESDQPSIGIILCKGKAGIEVEYALRGISKPIGVSEFITTQALPVNLKRSIPTVEEFERELTNGKF